MSTRNINAPDYYLIVSTSAENSYSENKKAIWLLVVIGIIIFIVCTHLYSNGGGAVSFLMLLLYCFSMGILFYNKSSKKLSFEAFVSNGYLNITFDQENNNLGVNEYRMTFFLSDIQSYTTHSFLGKKPAFIEIFAIGQQYEYQSRPIYVENLSKEELAKFTNFLDGIITKVRRLNA